MSTLSSSLLPPSLRPSRASALQFARTLGLLLATTVLMMADDWIQQLFTDANRADFELNFALGLLAFNIGLWLSGSRTFVAAILTLLATMELIQLGHISYFGRPLDPLALGSLFSDFHDVGEVAASDFGEHWHVLVSVLLPYALAMAIFARWLKTDIGRLHRLVGVTLIGVALLSKPYRATYRDINAFLPGPTRNALHNSLNTFSFFAVHHRTLLGMGQVAAQDGPEATASPLPSEARHVWLVVADSLRGDHLGVLGYRRDTTPLLDARADLIARPGLASGVSTAVSLPLMMNAIRTPGQLHQIRDLSTNLFRLAKEAGFKTYWISSQESKLLNDVGSRYIDVSITREDAPERFGSQGDDAILSLLDQQSWSGKTFTVILLRTAHAPYESNYEHDRGRYARWPDGAGLPREERLRNAYDNSVLYFDHLVDRIIQRFDRLQGPRHLIVTGDHGQLLGQRGLWGHNILEPEVASVPVLSLSRDAHPEADQPLRDARWISHFEMARWLVGQIGYRIDQPGDVRDVHYIQGKNLYGSNTFQEIREAQVLEFSPILRVGHKLPVADQ